MSLDVTSIRNDFPVLKRQISGKPLVYLDNANTSQKPQVVIDAMTNFMSNGYAPINRSAYQMAAEATDLYEGARSALAKFILSGVMAGAIGYAAIETIGGVHPGSFAVDSVVSSSLTIAGVGFLMFAFYSIALRLL